MKVKLQVTYVKWKCGYFEHLDLDDELEMYREQEYPRPVDDVDDAGFQHYIRPVSVTDVRSLNGNHTMYGWFESLSQSDHAPQFLWEDGEKLFECIHEEE